MPNSAGTLERLALELGEALKPLGDLIDINFFDRLGVQLPAAIRNNASLSTKLTSASAEAAGLESKITGLSAAITSDNAGEIIAKGIALIASIGSLIQKIKEIGDTLGSISGGLSAPDKAKVDGLAAAIAVRSLEYTLVGYFNERLPAFATALQFLGLIDKEITPVSSIEIPGLVPDFVTRRIYADRIPELLSHPDQYFKKLFKIEAGFNPVEIFKRVQMLLTTFGFPSEIYTPSGLPPALEAYIFTLHQDALVNPAKVNWSINIPGKQEFTRTIPFSNLWKGTIKSKAEFVAGIHGTYTPPFDFTIQPPSGNLILDLLIGLKAEKTGGEPIILIGQSGGTRLQAKSLGGSTGVTINTGTSGTAVSPQFQIGIEEGKLIIDFSSGDGFIQKILSGVRFEATFSLLGTWNPKEGLRLQGSGGVEVFIPLHLNLAIVEVKGLYFSITIGTDAPLKIGLATQFSTNLGPLQAVVDRIGTNIPITFPANGQGKLGIADIDFEFAPPTGIGLSIDGGGFKGGGFLYFNPQKGEYGGVLELEFQSLFSVKAIGILNTIMPDGSKGFSLLIIISAEFAPIQLGFGFTLNGVGGLLGLNRTMVVEKLAAGVKDGSLNYILFPQNVTANAPAIIQSVGLIFPPKQDQFVFGPMGKLGWGTPTLITVELGLLIEVSNPVRIAILGVIRCLLPTKDVSLIRIQVNFIGVIDFEKKELKFFASIFDSRLLTFTLSGDMALLISWGDSANFVLSVGGFHPSFTPPPMGLPALSRLTISLLDGNNPRLRLEAYFAITSNTVQFGAKLELYASVAVASIYGMLAFDVLIQFSPFYFIARIQAALAAKIFDITLFAVGLDFSLEGPSPWHAFGTATVSISFLFFSVSVDIDFDVTWGDRTDTALPPVQVLPKLVEAFKDKRNWVASLPQDAHQQVTLKPLPSEGPEADQIIVHPFGILTISQKLVPLNIDIQVLGNQKVEDASKVFRVESITDDLGGNYPTENVKEQFAPAQYFKMDDAQKISRKSFEQMDSGVRLAGASGFKTGATAVRTVRYDFHYLVKKKLIKVKGILMYLRSELFTTLLGGNAVAQSRLSKSSRSFSALAPESMTLAPEKYAVTYKDTLKAVDTKYVFDDESSAHSALNKLLTDQPALKGNVQIVPSYELNETA